MESSLVVAIIPDAAILGSINLYNKWGISAAGSAPHWQCGGHGFEPHMLHGQNYLI